MIGFKTGSLEELISPTGGIALPYSTDVWKFEEPDYNLIKENIQKIIANYSEFSRNARNLAIERYNINKVVSKYLEVINSSL